MRPIMALLISLFQIATHSRLHDVTFLVMIKGQEELVEVECKMKQSTDVKSKEIVKLSFQDEYIITVYVLSVKLQFIIEILPF